MVGEDLIGNDVAWHQTGDQGMPGHRCPTIAATAAEERRDGGVKVHAATASEVAGEQHNSFSR